MLAEYESLGFDEAYFDGLGSVIGRIGNGPIKILMDGHIDCVGVGDRDAWEFDPFEGKHEDGKIWGRGAVDELPAIAAMAYGARILADRGWPDDVTALPLRFGDGGGLRRLLHASPHRTRKHKT